MKTKLAADTAGRKLLKKMKGKGWELDVWENLGWHFAVRKVVFGEWTIAVYQGGHYGGRYTHNHWCMIGKGGGDGLRASCGSSKYFRDPNDAVEAEINKIEAALAPYNRLLMECWAFLNERSAKR